MSKQRKGVNRRQFLKMAGAGVGLALMPPAVTQQGQQALTALPGTGRQQAAQARSGVIKVGWEVTKKLDPAFIQTDSEISFCNAIYDYLIDPTPTAELSPRLAQSWKVNDDGKQYTFNLAKGVKFHDGKAMTAEDVVWTFQRLSSKDVGSPAASLYANVTDIKAVDDTTVTFTLSTTQPDFLYNIADSHALVLQAGTKDPNTTFTGTGPFKLDKFQPEDRATFVANENYWIQGLPKLAGMEHLYMESDAQLAALSGGQIDVVLRMPNARFIALKDDPNLQTVNYPTSGHDVLRIRVDQKPGNDPKVIKALKMATDRAKINEVVQLGLGAVGRDAPIGPYFKEYFDANSPLPPYDPEGARKLLADAGYPNGLEFDLHVPNTGGRPDFATVIKDQWAKAGITVNIKLEDESTYYSDNGWLEVPLGITGWAARPTPQQYLDFSLKTGGKWNETHISDPELDKQIDIAGTSLKMEERVAAYKEIQRILADHGPLVIPYFFPIVGAASKKFVFEKGFQPFTGRTDFREVTVKA
jgi:peptide/nickel transport system substrate-binding protein